MHKKAVEDILKEISSKGYTYHDRKTRPSFKEKLERERFRALNCTDSRIEELRNRAKQKLIIEEIKQWLKNDMH